MPYHILIIDDHPLIIEGIKLMLDGYSEYKISCSFTNLDDLLQSPTVENIDVIILDLNVHGSNSLDSYNLIKDKYKNAKIIAFTSNDTPPMVKECSSLGIEGYLIKDTTKTEFLNCLTEVIRDGIYYQEDRRILENSFDKTKIKIETIGNEYKLSIREKDIFKLLIEGDSEQEIADKLYLSKHTVHTHNKNLKRKLKVKNVVQMIKLIFSD